MKKIPLLLLFIITPICFLFSQNDSTIFKPSGSPIIRVFANYHAGLGNANNISGFELTRAYLGYEYKINPNLSGRVILDAAVPTPEGSTRTDIYLKNAMLSWKDKGFTINFGLIPLLQFYTQEKFWGYRYVSQSFQDLYKMGSGADLGITAQYNFASWISADISFINGEGYKRLNMNNSSKYGFGITIDPTQHFTLRIYTDLYNQSEDLRGLIPEGSQNVSFTDQKTLALFAGYKCSFFSIGGEYNHQTNKGFIKGCDYYGYSAYTSIPINKKWIIFGRYDYLDSNNPEGFSRPWSKIDGQMIIAGVEYFPIKQLKIAPNFKNFNPANSQSLQYIYLNADFTW